MTTSTRTLALAAILALAALGACRAGGDLQPETPPDAAASGADGRDVLPSATNGAPPPGDGPVVCGDATCPSGQVCCNASCGICTPPGGMCTQQICEE